LGQITAHVEVGGLDWEDLQVIVFEQKPAERQQFLGAIKSPILEELKK